MLDERIVRELAQIVGADNVSVDTADRILHAFDATQARFLPEVVVHATTTDQVSRVVRLAHEHRIPILSRGAGSGIMQPLLNYAYDIALLIALLVVASMFVGVCYHAYTRYAEIHTGRATWGQFGLTVAVGAILLVVGIWLLT